MISLDKDENIREEKASVIVGKFDGFHVGHQALLDASLESGLPVLVLRILTEDSQDTLLPENDLKNYLEKRGVSYYAEYVLDDAFKNLSPRAFVEEFLVSKFHMAVLTEGPDFRFGKNGSGNVELLKELSNEFHFDLHILEKKMFQGEAVSSSLIRQFLLEGKMEEVRMTLGYPYAISGEVQKGLQNGRRIGFPTANLSVPERLLLPRRGVYKTKVFLQGEVYDGISDLGTKPTIEGNREIQLETHIPGLSKNLYGMKIEVFFMRFIRDERKFESLEELSEQIKKDLETSYIEEDSYVRENERNFS